MTPRELLFALLDPEQDPPEELTEVALLLRAGRALREERESDLAHAEQEEGLYVDEATALAMSLEEPDGLRLAAASQDEDGPRVYRGGAWTLRWGSRADGGATVMLLGPGGAELVLGTLRVALPNRVWVAIPAPAPPPELTLLLPDGRVVLLRR